MNPLEELLGINLNQEPTEISEKAKETAVAIVKLTEYPEWKVFVEELDVLFKAVDKPCESYFINKELAGYDAGQKRSIELIKHFVKIQGDILKIYDEKRQEGN